MNILLDYFFPISVIEPTPAASTAFLKQVCVVAKPKSPHVAGDLVLCTSMTAVAAVTDNTDAQRLFDAGMNRVYILCASDLDLSTFLVGHESDFFTLLISGDYTDADVDATAASGTITVSSYANLLTTTPDTISAGGVLFTAQSGAATLGTATFQAATSNNATAASLAAQINAHAVASTKVIATVLNAVVTITAIGTGSSGNANTLAYTDNGGGNIGASVSGATLTGGDGLFVGAFKGVVGIASTDDTKNATRAAIANYCAFHTTSGNGKKNMFYAFGKLLSNSLNWLNQQYITVPYADDVNSLGSANSLFDSKVSFVISDTQFGNRLALFAQGGSAITAPYILRNLQIDMQSDALQFLSGNMPTYTNVNASLLETVLQKRIQAYIDKQWIEAGTVSITLEQDDFVASGNINVAKPSALWRIFGQMKQTL
jgi:hypothetical protein